MGIEVLFTSHRIEFLRDFEREAVNYDVLILEEPPNNKIFDYLEGKTNIDAYLSLVDTSFPQYTSFYLKTLKKLYQQGKKIFQVEPYLEKLNNIYELIEKGVVGGDETVRKIEGNVTKAWIEYQEAFIKKNFDELVEKTIEFTKKDAERFRVRDEMRAKEIAKILSSIHDNNILIEAGQIHILLPTLLKNEGFNVATKSIPVETAKKLGYTWKFNPGSELTVKYILGEKVDEEYEKTTAARALVYISMVSKEEMIPSAENEYPHLIDELKIVDFVSKLNYNSCKKIFESIWG